MTQLNLLPDIKLLFIRAQRRKRLVIGISFLTSAVFLAIFISLLLFVRVAQQQHMKALDNDINTSVATLKENEELDQILTIQNQLASLPAVHNDKQISSRLFEYLAKLTPKEASITEVTLDFAANTINVKGTAVDLKTVNKFADTAKFTEYNLNTDNSVQGSAFTNVVLKSYAVSSGELETGDVVYELEMNFDVAIFANSAPSTEGKSPIELVVPNITSTRSATQVPDNLFIEREQ